MGAAIGAVSQDYSYGGATGHGSSINGSSYIDNPDDCEVTTANSRGDYYHESRELWDPVANELIAIAQGALVRTKVPSGANADYAGLRIATSGLLSIDGVVFAPDRVVYAAAGDGGMTCGWTDGWRMHGIRGD